MKGDHTTMAAINYEAPTAYLEAFSVVPFSWATAGEATKFILWDMHCGQLDGPTEPDENKLYCTPFFHRVTREDLEPDANNTPSKYAGGTVYDLDFLCRLFNATLPRDRERIEITLRLLDLMERGKLRRDELWRFDGLNSEQLKGLLNMNRPSRKRTHSTELNQITHKGEHHGQRQNSNFN